MRLSDNNTQAFFVLLRAGLWTDAESTDLRNHGFEEPVDWGKVYHLAEEQSVLGVVLAGIERSTIKPPQEALLQWIGELQVIEQQNKAMNEFVAQMNILLWQNKIYGLLVKGQGVAQCYDRPLWRASGDIDLLLDDDNYEKAKALLIPLAEKFLSEDVGKKHLEIFIKGFDVELHGKMPFGLSRKADKVLDAVIEDSLKRGGVRVWSFNNSDIYLPKADNDVILVFTHFLHHFFIGGVGLRQICDWCRLLWCYRSELDLRALESRIRRMGLMSEWRVFGALAIEYLDMPIEAMPLFIENNNRNHNLHKKAKQVLSRVMKCGNFGHNNDLSYRARYSGFTYKIVSTWRRLRDFASLVPVFPVDAPKFFFTYLFNKAKIAVYGNR